MSETKRKFGRAQLGKYSLKEKEELGKLCKRYKEGYDASVDSSTNNVNYNDKMKKPKRFLVKGTLQSCT